MLTDTNVPKLLDVRQIRGNGRPARFLSDCTGETPMPPVQTTSLQAKGRWYECATARCEAGHSDQDRSVAQ